MALIDGNDLLTGGLHSVPRARRIWIGVALRDHVNVGVERGFIGPHYAASKGGLIGLARGYARPVAGDGVTANVITPALIDTEMVRSEDARPDLIPVGRFGAVDEAASLVLELVSNGYITGQTIGRDGGRYMT